MSEANEIALEAGKQENITRILDVAESLFRHYGYTKTNVADIARELGMSPANVYRFFRSKAEIHEAIARRMLGGSEEMARQTAALPLGATERLRIYAHQQHQITTETMMAEEKVHEMVIVAIENQWTVVESHIERLREIVASMIRDGIKSGEFAQQDADESAKCFCASLISLVHPQIVAQCPAKNNRATAKQLIEFVLKALKA